MHIAISPPSPHCIKRAIPRFENYLPSLVLVLSQLQTRDGVGVEVDLAPVQIVLSPEHHEHHLHFVQSTQHRLNGILSCQTICMIT